MLLITVSVFTLNTFLFLMYLQVQKLKKEQRSPGNLEGFQAAVRMRAIQKSRTKTTATIALTPSAQEMRTKMISTPSRMILVRMMKMVGTRVQIL